MNADLAAVARQLGVTLEQDRVAYAIGDALALGVHGALRATRDVDLNVFCEPAQFEAALTSLARAGVTFDHDRSLEEAAREGWFSGWLGAIRVDVFVPSIDRSRVGSTDHRLDDGCRRPPGVCLGPHHRLKNRRDARRAAPLERGAARVHDPKRCG